eukprot:TRINITY_DN2203_c0_g1_i1.p1 TRINITY_DN2203_c0_g1~~TRINITY_DN2203_c0_g1_i1.p1  ORF type:complete len:628 (+),score=68.24 TRINITY_DN2203_c0_g1_i1:913-2796(+)
MLPSRYPSHGFNRGLMFSRTEAFLCLLGFYVAAITLTCSRPVAPDESLTVSNHVPPVSSDLLTPNLFKPEPIYSLDAVAKFPNVSSTLDEVSVHKKHKTKSKRKKGAKKNKNKNKNKKSKNAKKKKKAQAKTRRASSKHGKKSKKKSRRHRPRSRKRSKSHFKPWTGCKTKRYACGKVCSGNEKSGKCKVTTSSPKLCSKKVKEKYACVGQRTRMCQREEKEPEICTKMERRTMPCDKTMASRKRVCREKKVSVKCVPKICATYDRIPCEYETIKEPCQRPSKRCNDCVGKYKLRQCSRTHTRQVETECPPDLAHNRSTSIGSEASSPVSSPTAPVSPTPSPTPRPFEDSNMFASNARCLASLFDEEECRYADVNCQLFSDLFDSTACAVQVCHDCRQLRYMPVSPGLKRYCFELLESSCRTLYSIHQVSVYRVQVPTDTSSLSPVARSSNTTFNSADGKCYKTESKTVSAPCNLPLPSGKSCINGCIVSTCERKVTKGGACRENLPDKCKKPKKCQKTETECSDVEEGAGNCEYSVPVNYVCYRKKKVSYPCLFGSRTILPQNLPFPKSNSQPQKRLTGAFNNLPKLCTRVVNKKYPCGSKERVQWTKCQQKGCRKKVCTKKVCRK